MTASDNAVRAYREDGQFGAVTQFFPQLNSLLHRIFVIFIHAEGQVGFVVPDPGRVRLETGLQVRDLFDADKQFHVVTS